MKDNQANTRMHVYLTALLVLKRQALMYFENTNLQIQKKKRKIGKKQGNTIKCFKVKEK